MVQISRGLDLPISGTPDRLVDLGPPVSHVALLGADYRDMKPTLLVTEGDRVILGQQLFSDKKNPRVLYTAPASGKVVAINRGERRAFLSLVIEVSGDEEKTFPAIA
jgi:Na+-transporting NADH:ubiquinone oxidoreductase subunit A